MNYTAIFEDDERGAAIFSELAARFVQPAVTKGGIDAITETYLRMGHREVIEYILLRINQEKGLTNVGTTVQLDGSGE